MAVLSKHYTPRDEVSVHTGYSRKPASSIEWTLVYENHPAARLISQFLSNAIQESVEEEIKNHSIPSAAVNRVNCPAILLAPKSGVSTDRGSAQSLDRLNGFRKSRQPSSNCVAV